MNSLLILYGFSFISIDSIFVILVFISMPYAKINHLSQCHTPRTCGPFRRDPALALPEVRLLLLSLLVLVLLLLLLQYCYQYHHFIIIIIIIISIIVIIIVSSSSSSSSIITAINNSCIRSGRGSAWGFQAVAAELYIYIYIYIYI